MMANRTVHFGTCAGLVLLLSACVAPQPAPAPAPPAQITPPPPRSIAPTDWHDLPATSGVWQWRREGRLSIARFGNPALLNLMCDPQRGTIQVTRSGASGTATTMAILTTSLSRKLTIQPGGGLLTATLSARDPLLDAMAFSRGRFAVEVPGLASLYLPSWPEVARVIEDCRVPTERAS